MLLCSILASRSLCLVRLFFKGVLAYRFDVIGWMVRMTLTSTHYRKLIQFLWMSSIAAEYNVELLVSEHVSGAVMCTDPQFLFLFLVLLRVWF
jgi:hypothetical protein